ncbi:MAG: hypothetical protein K2Y30_03990 [Flavobacteriaceae bacterium]|jgi:hypothetical protein|uniref:Uncharacterized protein n=1 Tax=Flavobacterium kayseriense TaxID=2764714 RepID=A0ABR7JB37_9FLAO|nr:hypothetical protein [Flavobacterium kayseriense]MBC5842748.1 hypothetical protein [Flavobacterium kayseriense]MBC5849278.1 hypothetical protein [Flavobacterium kayseriense]MBX9887080.1 hypothetical protein [Flavobacteriaceae bacterium]
MKNLKSILIALLFLIAGQSQAQVAVNVNIGTPPAWGPVGYSNVDYYYLPDVEAYYDIRASQFIYFGNGKWNRNKYLPGSYRNYDLYNGYKVVLNDYHGKSPYTYFKTHKVKYYKGYKGKPQKTIGTKNFKHSGKSYKKNSKDNKGKSGHSKNK